jgi:hypothetical protein
MNREGGDKRESFLFIFIDDYKRSRGGVVG